MKVNKFLNTQVTLCFHWFFFCHLSASQSLSTDDFIETSVKKNETKFIAYPLPTTDSGGLTFRVNSTDRNCSVIIYGSTFITTPNAAFHDFSLSTSTYEDIFIDRSNLFNPETATRMYLSIMSGDDSPDCNVRIDAQEGDTTTGQIREMFLNKGTMLSIDFKLSFQNQSKSLVNFHL